MARDRQTQSPNDNPKRRVAASIRAQAARVKSDKHSIRSEPARSAASVIPVLQQPGEDFRQIHGMYVGRLNHLFNGFRSSSCLRSTREQKLRARQFLDAAQLSRTLLTVSLLHTYRPCRSGLSGQRTFATLIYRAGSAGKCDCFLSGAADARVDYLAVRTVMPGILRNELFA
jgi:hypothetical protein